MWAVVTNAGKVDAGTNEFSNCLALRPVNSSRQVLLKSVCLWTAAKATSAEVQLHSSLHPTLHQPESLRVVRGHLYVNKPPNYYGITATRNVKNLTN